MMLENGELSSFFSCGKAPSAKRPPKLQHESAIPKLKVEPITKPRINTGIMKAKPKVFSSLIQIINLEILFHCIHNKSW